jgi:hypothetical protein
VTGTNRTGKFRVDYFRIERLSDLDPDGLKDLRDFNDLKVLNETYDLAGRKMTGQLPKGIYIRNGQKVVIR